MNPLSWCFVTSADRFASHPGGIVHSQVPSRDRTERFACSAGSHANVVPIHDVFYLSSLVTGVTAPILGRPVVLTQHVDLIRHPSRVVEAAQRTVFRTYGRFLFSISARILVLNDRVQEFVAEGGAASERIEFLQNGVDVEAYRPALKGEAAQQRIALGLPLDRVLVLFAGRPVPKKGFDLLADCAGPEFDLVFVGGEQRPMEIGRNGGRSYFLGSVPRVRMREIYRAADVFCLPSLGEGFPLTVQEAMASGLPVITTDDEAYRRYQVPPEAICFVRRDQVELEGALNRLAHDAALRVQIGQRAREYVLSHFSWETHAQRLVQIYREVQMDHEAGSRRYGLFSSRRRSRKQNAAAERTKQARPKSPSLGHEAKWVRWRLRVAGWVRKLRPI